MLIPSLISSLLTCFVVQGTGDFEVRINGNAVGKATLRTSLTRNGLTSLSKIWIESAYVATEKSWSKSGQPRYVKSSGVISASKYSRTILYANGKVSVVLSLNGKSTSEVRTIPRGGSANNPTELWFLTSKPKPKTQVSYWEIDDSSKWRKETIRYAGKVKMNFRGKNVDAHYIKGQYMERWCDDAGSNYLIKWTEGKGSVDLLRKK